jgi:hypothetical protein
MRICQGAQQCTSSFDGLRGGTYHEGMARKRGGNKDPLAVALGRRGGKATASRRTPRERSEAARKAVLARWAREKGKKKNRVGTP